MADVQRTSPRPRHDLYARLGAYEGPSAIRQALERARDGADLLFEVLGAAAARAAQ